MAFKRIEMKINYSKIAKRILSKYYKAKTSYTKRDNPNKYTNNTKANNKNNNNHNSPY